jgi:hypothetical protein
MNTKSFFSALAVTALVAPAFAADQAVTFTPKFTKGAEARFTMQWDSTSTQAGMGQSNKTTTKREVNFVTRVKEIDAQGATIDLTYDRIAINFQEPSKTFSFDSNNPTSQDPKSFEIEQIRPICGQTFTLKVSNDGEVLEVITPANLPPQSSIGPLARDFVTVPGISRTFGRLWGFNSDAPYGTGQTWDVQRLVPDAPLELRLTTTYKFDSMKGDIATVTSDGKAVIEATKNGNPLPFNLSEFKASGTYAWNTTTGGLDSMTYNWTSGKAGDMSGLKLDFNETYTLRITRN